MPTGGFEVDVVHAHRVVRDDAELRACRVEERIVDLHGQHRNDPVRFRDAVDELEVVRDRLFDFGWNALDEIDARPHPRIMPCGATSAGVERLRTMPRERD